MSDYTSTHASAYRDVLKAGVAVTATRTVATEDGTTGVVTPSTTTIELAAFAKRGDPNRLTALGLTFDSSITLFTSPRTHVRQDAFVKPNDRLPWGGETYTVRDVGPLVALNGYVIAATVVAGR